MTLLERVIMIHKSEVLHKNDMGKLREHKIRAIGLKLHCRTY